MKKLRFLAGCTAVLIGGLGVLAACSDDDTDVAPTDNADGGDANVKPDGSPPLDAGGDTTVDAPPFDAGLKLDTYPVQVADGICRSYARCCFNNANLEAGAPVDGGTFDQTRCLDVFRRFGFESSNLDFDLVDGGNVALDQKAAADCLTKLGALSCGALTAAEFQAARALCFSAFQGTLAAGQACKSSIQCGAGLFCKTGDGGASGTCEALRPADAGCGDFTSDTVRANEACSYRASGKPDLHCDVYDFTKFDYRDAGDWKCVPGVANGKGCLFASWCASGQCNPQDLMCEDPLPYFSANSCKFYVKP
jgi:hypothetical protein